MTARRARAKAKRPIRARWGLSSYAENAAQIRSADQDLRVLRVAIHLAAQMGEGLGRGQILFRPVPAVREIGKNWRLTWRKDPFDQDWPIFLTDLVAYRKLLHYLWPDPRKVDQCTQTSTA